MYLSALRAAISWIIYETKIRFISLENREISGQETNHHKGYQNADAPLKNVALVLSKCDFCLIHQQIDERNQRAREMEGLAHE